MDEEKLINFTVNQLRLLRHNVMNSLQVIYAYLQINKPDKAIEYIKEINKNMSGLSLIYNLENPWLSLFMQYIIMEIEKIGVDYEIITSIDYIPSDVFTKNNKKIFTLFEKIKQYLINNLRNNGEGKKLYIEVGLDENMYVLSFYNTKLKDEIKSTTYEVIYKMEGTILKLYKLGNCFLLELSIEQK
ncbi:Sensor_kinase_SpoOB-type, alpha-helical domain [Caloramator fervidus]|uniref:Sensor_kinase_SpoOB-type, alpha-helical domain n=1 Tax=Caloramator fervidus TaxID=29344 RepID=A0A1H5VQX2_9CLOT|nr:Spo0B domain-containing protein [Caloramator fervidus]SEF89416.1 Sensor_kinase_SpoOB-type, alpha-helical domain [Caloramator fervidus]